MDFGAGGAKVQAPEYCSILRTLGDPPVACAVQIDLLYLTGGAPHCSLRGADVLMILQGAQAGQPPNAQPHELFWLLVT